MSLTKINNLCKKCRWFDESNKIKVKASPGYYVDHYPAIFCNYYTKTVYNLNIGYSVDLEKQTIELNCCVYYTRKTNAKK